MAKGERFGKPRAKMGKHIPHPLAMVRIIPEQAKYLAKLQRKGVILDEVNHGAASE